jgi:predicted adenylyl cyclase CyaB
MLNFEVKTRISNFEEILKKIQNIGAVYKETMSQIDYYFKIGIEKEKIREINHHTMSLISYKRLEKGGRKDSNYDIKTLSLKQKKTLLEHKPLLCLVDKTRQLWMYKNTRIHIDNVVGLGNFMELETVVKDISKNQGLNEFKEVVKKLEIDLEETEPFSYSDLILNKKL